MLMFGDTEIEKNNFYCNKTPIFFKDVDIAFSIKLSNKISFGEKTINTLLGTCIMTIELIHCIWCFLKQAHK